MTTPLTEILEPGLHRVAVCCILVPHDNKLNPWFSPRSQFAYNALFQILLAFMFYASERQTGEKPVKEHIQQIGH